MLPPDTPKAHTPLLRAVRILVASEYAGLPSSGQVESLYKWRAYTSGEPIQVESLRRVDTDGALRLCAELRCLLKVPMSLWRCALTLVDITTPGLSA